MKVAVVEFPGYSAADETVRVYRDVLGQEAYKVWYNEMSLDSPDFVVLPGGAAFGDYLRPGALVKSSTITGPVRTFATNGGPVLGIGNGFQILSEIGLLPGTLLQNESQRFCGDDTYLSVETSKGPFLNGVEKGTVLQLPLACYFGRYVADRRTLKELEENGHVALRYCDDEGDPDEENPLLGSQQSIAGILSRHENVMGIMPHPERAVEELLGSTDGKMLLLPKVS